MSPPAYSRPCVLPPGTAGLGSSQGLCSCPCPVPTSSLWGPKRRLTWAPLSARSGRPSLSGPSSLLEWVKRLGGRRGGRWRSSRVLSSRAGSPQTLSWGPQLRGHSATGSRGDPASTCSACLGTTCYDQVLQRVDQALRSVGPRVPEQLQSGFCQETPLPQNPTPLARRAENCTAEGLQKTPRRP